MTTKMAVIPNDVRDLDLCEVSKIAEADEGKPLKKTFISS